VPLLKRVKEGVEKLTGLWRPSWPEVEKAVRLRKPRLLNFDDHGLIPNSPLPLVIYRGVVRLTKTNDPAALFEVLFAHCGWKGSWRNGIYDFAHYHSRAMKFWASPMPKSWCVLVEREAA
jgi:hypothetical protein